MLTDIFLFIIGLLLKIFVFLASTIQFITPTWIEEVITSAFSYIGILNGIFPIYPHPEMTGLVSTVGILTILGTLLYIVYYYYVFKLLLLVFHFLPFIGKKVHLPHH